MDITNAINRDILIILVFIFVLKFSNESRINPKLTVRIPMMPIKGIESFKKINDQSVTKTGAHPLAMG